MSKNRNEPAEALAELKEERFLGLVHGRDAAGVDPLIVLEEHRYGIN